jgi:hypothetical protein
MAIKTITLQTPLKAKTFTEPYTTSISGIVVEDYLAELCKAAVDTMNDLLEIKYCRVMLSKTAIERGVTLSDTPWELERDEYMDTVNKLFGLFTDKVEFSLDSIIANKNDEQSQLENLADTIAIVGESLIGKTPAVNFDRILTMIYGFSIISRDVYIWLMREYMLNNNI